MSSVLHALEKFWQQHPALLYALFILLGIATGLSWNLSFLFPLSLLILPLLISSRRRLFLGICLTSVAYFFVNVYYLFPLLPPEGIPGTAFIEITSVSSKTSHFGKQWSYRGTIKKFITPEGHLVARNIPYTLSIPQKDDYKRPPADQSYKIIATLKELMPGYYALSIDKNAPWIPLDGTWSFAEWRFHTKQNVTTYIREHISGSNTSTFLAGIATGDFDDRTMVFEFGRFGLQHIMAISGFHFAIIAAILSGFLRLIISPKKATYFLIFLLSSYFIFLGCGSSIMRAWISILIVLCGYLLERRGSGLNSLGIGMLAILIFDPLQCRGIGFQFSFITTAAILLFFPISDYLMQWVLKKRPLRGILEMDRMNQHGYCILSFFRQALALTIAVNIIALPMTLYYFHKFPILSILYNLFFPFLVSISMLMLILGMAISLIIPPIGSLINGLNQVYTQLMLNFIYNMPTTIDVIWRISDLPLELVIAYVTLLFGAGICLKHYLEQCHADQQDLAFV